MSLGYNQKIWFKEAATYGEQIAATGGTIMGLFVKPNITLAKTIARIKSEHIRGETGPREEDDALGLISVQGGFGGFVPTSLSAAFTHLIKHTTGRVVTTGTNPYAHLFGFYPLLFPGITVFVNKGAATYCYDGLQVANLKLGAKIGGGWEYFFDFIGTDERVIALEAGPNISGYVATPHYLFQHGTFSIDGVTEPITEWELNVTNELESADEKSYALGSNVRTLLPLSGRNVTGFIKRRHDRDSGQTSKFYAKFLSGASASIVLTMTSPVANHSAVITLAKVKFEGETPNNTDKGNMLENIPFTAYDLDYSTPGTSNITFNDTIATPTTASGAYDGAGA